MNVVEPLLETTQDAINLFALLIIVLLVAITILLIFINYIKKHYEKRHDRLKQIHQAKRID